MEKNGAAELIFRGRREQKAAFPPCPPTHPKPGRGGRRPGLLAGGPGRQSPVLLSSTTEKKRGEIMGKLFRATREINNRTTAQKTPPKHPQTTRKCPSKRENTYTQQNAMRKKTSNKLPRLREKSIRRAWKLVHFPAQLKGAPTQGIAALGGTFLLRFKLMFQLC